MLPSFMVMIVNTQMNTSNQISTRLTIFPGFPRRRSPAINTCFISAESFEVLERLMGSNDVLRRQLIHNLIATDSDNVVEDVVIVWEKLTQQIIATVGVGGFDALFARSLFITQHSFPWLSAVLASEKGRLGTFKVCLEAQPSPQMIEANALLLLAFTDILATLIGEELTANILNLAWG